MKQMLKSNKREESQYFTFVDENLERERVRVKIGYCNINIEVHAMKRQNFLQIFGSGHEEHVADVA